MNYQYETKIIHAEIASVKEEIKETRKRIARTVVRLTLAVIHEGLEAVREYLQNRKTLRRLKCNLAILEYHLLLEALQDRE